MAASQIDWNLTNMSSIVSLDTRSKVNITTSGPPRTSSNQPVLIIVPGVAGTSLEYPALIRALSPFVRVLCYDRPGLGQSPKSSTAPSLESIVADIHAVLRATNINPPYITLAHSWGGMVSTVFAASLIKTPGALLGMVMLDAGSPSVGGKYQDFTTDPGSPWSNPSVLYVVSGLDLDILSITHPPNETALAIDEYNALQSETRTHQYQSTVKAEFAALQQSYRPFASATYLNRSPPLLPGTPVVTIHAHAHSSYERLYHLSVIKGTGSEIMREAFEALLPTWRERVLANQKQFLALTVPENQLCITAKPGTGHNVQMMDVESCVKAVKWVLTKRGYDV